ncbi:MAG: UDP-N-acetylmuramoyl-tripeptide--D-alanyl-D-alanine ligase [Spirochaetia bacterium]|nr:UDP-N-acetylmuramoyl-tripeptide--D-alanyl-D-alanine ligase [Spirochaetia bacterium]
MRPVAFYELLPLVSSIAGSQEIFFRGAAVDSRLCEAGQLFVALPGERTDGHLFVPELIEKGVSAFLVSSAYANENRERINRWVEEDRASFLIADDTLTVLQKAAAWYLEQLPQVQRVGITGSSGKTTTKELIASVLRRKYRISYTQGNLNSEIGLPLVAFSVDPDDEIAVFEMGINHPGEMGILAEIVKPQTAVITNIFPAHAGMFAEIDSIAREKMKIFSRAGGHLTAFINCNDCHGRMYRDSYPGNYIPFGMGVTEGVSVIENRGFGGWLLRIGESDAVTPLFGRYNLENICAATAVGRAFGLTDEEIADGVEAVESAGFARGCIRPGRITVVEDCYNANPGSVAAAIELFRETEVEGRKIFVAGAMKELGVHSQRLHAELGRTLAAAAFDRVLFYGDEAAAAFDSYCESGGSNGFFSVDIEELKKDLKQNAVSGDWVFLKGSRSLQLERLASVFE